MADSPSEGLSEGALVRLRGDPGRVGVLTGRERNADSRYLQVRFGDGTQWIPADELEVVRPEGDSPLDMLRRGRLASPADLYRTLTHIRLSGRLSNFIYSLETTDTDFYAYQFKPVVKLLQSAGTGILVADEVGLGKTIEAGLIWTELRSRFDLQRLLVVCPAMLREKWVRELKRRFGVKATVCDAQDLSARLRAISRGEESELAVVASLQGLRPPVGWDDADEAEGPRAELARLLGEGAEGEPLIDLLVIDEAHYMRNPETRTFALGRLLRAVSQYAVLLSATPVHLKSEDLFNVLRIVDEDAFSRKDVFELIRQANEDLVTARDEVLTGQATSDGLIRLLTRASAHPLLEGNRQLERLIQDLKGTLDVKATKTRVAIAARLEAANLFGFAVTRTRRREVKEWRAVRSPVTLRVPMNALESRFYQLVTDTVREFAERSGENEGFLLVMPQRQVASCMAAALWYWSQDQPELAEEMNEELGIDLPDAEPAGMGPLITELRARAAALGDPKALAREDSKYDRLLSELRASLSEEPGRKVVLFSSFRHTLKYLCSRLQKDGFSCALLLGGDKDAEEVLDSFSDPHGPAVLLSSEVGSEGIDLQFAWTLVNYDLPWNPMRVEQRIGRLDRIGQESEKVVIWNLLHEATIDERIYDRLYERLGIFYRTLGGLEPILGERLKALERDLLRRSLTPDQQTQRIDQTATAIENQRHLDERLEEEAASLVAYGDYIVQQVHAARDLSRRLRSEDLRKYALDYLARHYKGCRMVEDPADAAVVEMDLSAEARHDLSEFLRERRLGSVTALARAGPAVRCRFENRLRAAARAGEEIVSQLHPLIRFVAREAEARNTVVRPALAARLTITDPSLDVPLGDYRFAVSRWAFEALRPSEQLWFGVEQLHGQHVLSDDDAERLVMAVAEHGVEWPAAVDEMDLEDAAKALEGSLGERSWSAYEARVQEMRAQNEDLADAQRKSLETHMRSQGEKYELQLAKHRRLGNRGLEKATLKNLETLRKRIDQEKARIERRRQLAAHLEEIAVGVVRVE